jgi:heme o synthase
VSEQTNSHNPWRTASWRLAQACTVLVLFMIAVGAIVTTIRAGDTNPEWSLRFWEWVQTWWATEGGQAYEDGHRIIGTVIGFLGIALAFTMFKSERGWRRWLGVIALLLIISQGILGGIRVLVVSDPDVRDTVLTVTGGGYDVELRRAVKAMIHGVTAQIIFAGLACIAVLTSPRWLATHTPQRTVQARTSRMLSLGLLVLLTVQLTLGTLVRQTGEHVMWHVAGAFVVTLAILWMIIRVFRYHDSFKLLRVFAGALGVLLVCQVFLGITPWMITAGQLESDDPFAPVSLLRSAHVTVGALLMAVTAVLSLWLHRLVAPSSPGAAQDESGTAGAFDRGADSKLRDYAQLTKIRLSGLVMVTVAAGFLIATPTDPNLSLMAAALIGVALVAAGVAALNQYIERDLDRRMERTRNRPLPSGRMHPTEALVFGLATILAGLVMLVVLVNWLSAALTALTAFLYVLVYTPLKTRSTLNTLVGAVTGALPPVIGWAAATGGIAVEAFVLFAILYVWQIPHFWAIARLYREDYSRGGMRMLGVSDQHGGLIAGQIVLWCLALLVTSLLPMMVGMAGPTYVVVALLLGLGFLGTGLLNAIQRTRTSARGVFFASLIYLPLLLVVMLFDLT